MPSHREVRAVELQQEAGRDDGLVLLAHRGRDRVDIRLVRRIVAVPLECRDDPRRSRIHEGLARAMARDGVAKIREVLVERGAVDDLDRTDACGPPELLRPGHPRDRLARLRMRREIEGRRTGMMAFEPREPILDVRRVADLADLAVADDVETDLDLPRHDLV